MVVGARFESLQLSEFLQAVYWLLKRSLDSSSAGSPTRGLAACKMQAASPEAESEPTTGALPSQQKLQVGSSGEQSPQNGEIKLD